MRRADEIQLNIAEVASELRRASSGWDHQVQLCAVTKTVDAETVNLLHPAGVRIIGENRVQEAVQKLPALNPDFELHIIGQLQTNKVKYVVDCASMVQSLDRIDLAREIDRRAQARGVSMPALVQVNIARELQKAGVDEDELDGFVRQCAALKGIDIQGLMAIMPYAKDPEQIRPYFRRMRAWFDRLRAQGIERAPMNTLSMGMSGDYIVAAQEGATMVRVGSRIFGNR